MWTAILHPDHVDYMIGILCSGHTDLYDCHCALRLHGPIQLPICAQVTWTYDWHFVLRQHGPIIGIWHSGHMDL